jgi:hypothetical protein
MVLLHLSSVSAPWSSTVGRQWRPPALLRCGGPACVQHVLLALRVTATERMARIGASLVALRSSKVSPLSAWHRSAVLDGGGMALAVDDVAHGVPDEQASSAAGSGLRPPYCRLVSAGTLFWVVFFLWGRRVPSATTSLVGDDSEVTVLSELRFDLDCSIIPGGFPVPVDVVVSFGSAVSLRQPPGLPLLGLGVVDICVFRGARYVCPGCHGEHVALWRLLGINLSRISVCLGIRRSFDIGESVELVPSCILLGACIGVRCRSWSRPLVQAVKMLGRSMKGPYVWNMVLRQVVVGSAWLLQFLGDDGGFVDRDAWEGSPVFVP